MTLQEVQNLVLKLQKTYIKSKIYNHIRCHYKEAYNFIEQYFEWPKDTLSSTKLFWIMNNLTEIPKCIVCKKTLDINQISKRTKKYVLHCSHYCGCHSPHAREAFKQTCLKKYGAEHNMQSDIGIKEYSNSIKAKYGTNYTFQNTKIKQKSKQTCLKKYGIDVISKAKEIKEKISAANKNKTQIEKDIITSKIKKTKLERYGNANYVNSKLAQKTMLERYGVKCSFNMQTCKDKISLQSKIKSYTEILCNDIHDRPCFTLQQYIERKTDSEYLEFECLKCHKKFLSRHHDGFHDHCQECYPKEEKHEEKNFGSFIRSLVKNVIENTRLIIKPQELDVYCPDQKIAFEFDGLYWHSQDVCKEKINYHLHKTEECEKKGIQLIHVFENEWLQKQDIVKSRIKNLFGIYDKTVFARKCEVREVDSKTSRQFQEDNHIQGAVNQKVSLGLYFDDELISLMTFGKCRFDKKHEWELLRFCNKLGHHVPGAASKLLKHFERDYKPKSLVSYADRRWSQGKVYKTLGFTLLHIAPPNYWYWKTNNLLESRIKYQKHKLCNILETFDISKSETQNMTDNGYHKIYDCGNLVFEKYF